MLSRSVKVSAGESVGILLNTTEAIFEEVGSNGSQ